MEQEGTPEPALRALAEALPLVDARNEPRDRMGVRFNIVVNLWHLDRFAEAEASLAELRPLVVALGNNEDRIRLDWLVARIAAGMNRRDEALAGLIGVQGEFRARDKAYDSALVGLEIAVLQLDAGRFDEVAALAIDMAWIFDAKDVHREARAALQLFQEAAARKALSLDLARQLLGYLESARHDPRPFVQTPALPAEPARG